MPRHTPVPPPSHDPSPWRALLFAGLGYVYIVLVVGAMLAVIALGVRHGVGLLVSLPLGLLFSILAALWMSTPEPEGIPLSRGQAPALFRAMDRARGRLRAPEADVVLLSAELNAGVLERPRLGIPWWRRRYLIVGLPLLHALSEDEAEAILAHEFAHLSRDHNRLRRWLVRALNAWTQLGVGLRASRHWGAVFFVPFMRGYLPRLERLAQAASRAHEFESDRLAARVVGAEVAGRALLRLAAAGHRLETEAWPAILAGSWTEKAPPPDTFPRVLHALAQPPAEGTVPALLRTVLAERTLEGHSHPSLRERLENLGQSGAALRGMAAPAARTLLPELDPATAAALERLWTEQVTPLWRDAHADARVCREDAGGAGDGEGARAARWARARWSAQCEPAAAAIPLLRAVLDETPGHADAAVQLGSLLVAGDDPAGVDEGLRLLEGAAERNSLAALAAVQVLQQQYARQGRGEALRRAVDREQALRQAAYRDLHERGRLEAGDALRPYPLAPARQAALVRAVRAHREVRQAFLVQKQSRHLDGSPVVVLAICVHVPWYRPSIGVRGQEIAQALLPEFHIPEALDQLVTVVEPRGTLLRRLRSLPGAVLFGPGAAAPEAVSAEEWSMPSRLQRLTRPGPLTAAAVVVLFGAGVVFAMTEDSGADPMQDLRPLPALRAEARDRPGDAGAHRQLAWGLVKAERWDEALPALQTAVRLNPRDAELHNALGWVLNREERFAEAVAPLRRAVALAPDESNAHHNLGNALYRLGRLQESERAYRFVIELRPGSAVGHTALGWVLIEQRRLTDAERSFARALQLDSTLAEAQGGMGTAQLQAGRMDDAVASFRRSVALEPEDAKLWGELGRALHLGGDYAASAAAFDRAEQVDPSYFSNPYRAGMRAASRAGRAYEAPPEA